MAMWNNHSHYIPHPNSGPRGNHGKSIAVSQSTKKSWLALHPLGPSQHQLTNQGFRMVPVPHVPPGPRIFFCSSWVHHVRCAKSCSSPVRWAIRLSGFVDEVDEWLVQFSISAAFQRFFHLFPMKKWIFGDLGIGLWGRQRHTWHPQILGCFGDLSPDSVQLWKSLSSDVLLQEAFYLSSWNQAPPLNLLVFPRKFKYPNSNFQHAEKECTIKVSMSVSNCFRGVQGPRSSQSRIRKYDLEQTPTYSSENETPFPKNTNHWKCLPSGNLT